MSKFKEQVAKDLDVFINADEFADYHLLNGQKIKMIISTDENSTASYSRSSSFDDNVFNCDVVVEYKYSDYSKYLKYGEKITLDNIFYSINHFSVSDGLTTLALSRKA